MCGRRAQRSRPTFGLLDADGFEFRLLIRGGALQQRFVGRPRGFDLPERGAAVLRKTIKGADGGEGAAIGDREVGATQPIVEIGERVFGAGGEHGAGVAFGDALDVGEAEANGRNGGWWMVDGGWRRGRKVRV